MDRLVQHNVLAMSGRAVEAAGDVNTLLLDKTGTITLGNRQATRFIPVPGVTPDELANAAHSLPCPTKRPKAAPSWCWPRRNTVCAAATLRITRPCLYPLRHKRVCRGVNLNGFEIRKGAAEAITRYVEEHGLTFRPKYGPPPTKLPAPAARRWSSRKKPAARWASSN